MPVLLYLDIETRVIIEIKRHTQDGENIIKTVIGRFWSDYDRLIY